jgi:hypothetical protein
MNAEGSAAVDDSQLKFSTKPAVAAAAAPTPAEGVPTSSSIAAADCSDEAAGDGDTDVSAAAAGSVAVGKAPAKLYRQGNSLVLQTHGSCQYQFAVSRECRQSIGCYYLRGLMILAFWV